MVRHGRRARLFRKPYGKGWALVGDTRYNRDPITAQGISDAFIDAESSDSAQRGWSGTGTLEDLLANDEAARNERVRPMYESPVSSRHWGSPSRDAGPLKRYPNQDATNAFLSAITAPSLPDFRSNENLGRIMAAARM